MEHWGRFEGMPKYGKTGKNEGLAVRSAAPETNGGCLTVDAFSGFVAEPGSKPTSKKPAAKRSRIESNTGP